MSDGKGCKCGAYGSNECGCGADWTPQEVYDLRERVRVLEEALKNISDAVDFEGEGKHYDSVIKGCFSEAKIALSKSRQEEA